MQARRAHAHAYIRHVVRAGARGAAGHLPVCGHVGVGVGVLVAVAVPVGNNDARGSCPSRVEDLVVRTEPRCALGTEAVAPTTDTDTDTDSACARANTVTIDASVGSV